MTGYRGTFVISWSQTQVDGLTGAPVGTIELGANWRWHGGAVRIDGPNDLLVLTGHEGEADLRARAGRAVKRILGGALPAPFPNLAEEFDEPVFDRYFVVSDGLQTYPVTLIDIAETARPLLLFLDALPPEDTDLWVVRCVEEKSRINRITDQPAGVICFAEGTLLDTPEGARTIETLAEGDRVLTRDDGPQEVLWVGSRHITGARIYAMPHLRPIRIRSGALGGAHPSPDLIVSPQHRLLLKGAVAQELFNTREVLVAASDMLNDRTILRDHSLREVRYYHLLLARHQVVWANGVEAESFHPAHTSLDTIEPAQRAALLDVLPDAATRPHGYGPAARRMLTPSEAAILLYEARNRHAGARRAGRH
ncbi:MAG TPA: Hint domain-containing protein [Thermopetrobacter sp.]|nr:Hint domain-containing protein [Thermopetrobacter sp.]